MSAGPARRLRLGAAALLVALVAACSADPEPGAGGPAAGPAPAITVSPGAGATEVDPLAPVQVAAADGELTTVTMTNEEGRSVEGVFTPDHTAWKPSEPLGYNRTYTLTAEGLTVTGRSGPVTSTFSTIKPGNQTRLTLSATGGAALTEKGTYGVGTVIAAHFDENIPDRAAAEKRLRVTTDPPVTGSWYWVDARTAHWRPEKYYAPGTKVRVAADIYGADLGNGLYGQEDASAAFTIGPSHVSIADDETKQVQVFENGTLIRTMPTSMGMGGTQVIAGKSISFWTQPGVYTVMDKANPVIMDSSTYGLPVNSKLGYKEEINWATRISTDGVYLHQNEATVWAQGNTDVSHGCLNLSGENARWFYDFANPGDVVEVRNTGGSPLEVWQNGDWSVPWSAWQEGSALR
ncbi:L,D-transpeptidase [Nocardia thailandica]